MALKVNFYNEIFENEQKWIELINKNLLNSIYCKLALKPFYIKKRNEIAEEYKTTDNQILRQILSTIDNIIIKIDEFNDKYESSEIVDIKELLPLFLTNQMNNDNQKENESIELLKKKRQILEDEIRSYINDKPIVDNDYLYDDFPEENRKVM